MDWRYLRPPLPPLPPSPSPTSAARRFHAPRELDRCAGATAGTAGASAVAVSFPGEGARAGAVRASSSGGAAARLGGCGSCWPRASAVCDRASNFLDRGISMVTRSAMQGGHAPDDFAHAPGGGHVHHAFESPQETQRPRRPAKNCPRSLVISCNRLHLGLNRSALLVHAAFGPFVSGLFMKGSSRAPERGSVEDSQNSRAPARCLLAKNDLVWLVGERAPLLLRQTTTMMWHDCVRKPKSFRSESKQPGHGSCSQLARRCESTVGRIGSRTSTELMP